jgi:hypothetical protein
MMIDSLLKHSEKMDPEVKSDKVKLFYFGDTILRVSKQLLDGYGVGQYECSFTVSDTEIELVDTVFPCVNMKVTDNASNIKKAFKFFDDEETNRKRK